jgi:RNA polymerase sigma factor (TIGR02999 family)
MSERHDITRLLQGVGREEPGAIERVIPLVYDELRHIARRYLRPNGGTATLNTTGLVHEAYMRLVDQTQASYDSRSHFLAVCAVVMRNLVVDFARSRKAAKRGGGAQRVTLEEQHLFVDAQAENLIALDQALDRLQEYDDKLARVVECRYFAGLTEVETSQALGLSVRSVRRYWIKAKALLHQMLT